MSEPGILTTVATLASSVIAHAAAKPSPALWYITRAAAVCAYGFLSLTAILGLARSLARVRAVRAPGTLVVLDDAHQFSALLTAAFVALHLVTLLLDPFLPFSLRNLLLPADEPYRPLASALGVLTLYALVIVLLSSWLRRRLSYSFWRSLHYISFVAFVLVTAHGLLAGSDTGQPWMSRLYLLASLCVGGLVVLRVVLPPRGARAMA